MATVRKITIEEMPTRLQRIIKRGQGHTLKCVRECIECFYALPYKPMDVDKPVKAIIKSGDEYYEVNNAFVWYDQGWTIVLPCLGEEIKLLWMDYVTS